MGEKAGTSEVGRKMSSGSVCHNQPVQVCLRKVSPGPRYFMMIFRSSRLLFHKMRSSSFVHRQSARVFDFGHCLNWLSSVLAHVSHPRSDITLTVYLRLPLVPVAARSSLAWAHLGAWPVVHTALNRWPLVCLVPSQAEGPGRGTSCTDSALSGVRRHLPLRSL